MDALTRDFPSRPVPAVSGVVFQEDKVLLVQRKVAPYAGRWSLPGGAVEVGEPLREAVVREVGEETGLKVRPMKLVGAYDSIVEEGGTIRFHYVLLDFLCKREGGELRPGTDASAAAWVSLADLKKTDLTPLAERAIRDGARIRSEVEEEG